MVSGYNEGVDIQCKGVKCNTPFSQHKNFLNKSE